MKVFPLTHLGVDPATVARACHDSRASQRQLISGAFNEPHARTATMYEDTWYSFAPPEPKAQKEDNLLTKSGHRRRESLLKQPNVSPTLTPRCKIMLTLRPGRRPWRPWPSQSSGILI